MQVSDVDEGNSTSLGRLFHKYASNIEDAKNLANGGAKPKPTPEFALFCYQWECDKAEAEGLPIPTYNQSMYMHAEPPPADEQPCSEQPDDDQTDVQEPGPDEARLSVPHLRRAEKAGLSRGAVAAVIEHKAVSVHLLAFNLGVDKKQQASARRQPAPDGSAFFAPSSPSAYVPSSPSAYAPNSPSAGWQQMPSVHRLPGSVDPSPSHGQASYVSDPLDHSTMPSWEEDEEESDGWEGGEEAGVRRYRGPLVCGSFEVAPHMPSLCLDEH